MNRTPMQDIGGQSHRTGLCYSYYGCWCCCFGMNYTQAVAAAAAAAGSKSRSTSEAAAAAHYPSEAGMIVNCIADATAPSEAAAGTAAAVGFSAANCHAAD